MPLNTIENYKKLAKKNHLLKVVVQSHALA